MTHTLPDGAEVVATRADAEGLSSPPFLIIDAVREYLDRQGLGSGEIGWSRIGDGQSNVTYRITRGADTFVLRRGPRPPFPKSTHDMVREAKIQQLVRHAGISVPEILAVCDDVSVLGVPFYLMEFISGDVITDRIPPALDSPQQRRATSVEMVDTLVRLHQVDTSQGELAKFGRSEGYLKRQIGRFSSLWLPSTQRDLPEVAAIGSWLEDNIPEGQASTIVHGDYRLGNLMFDNQSPARVRAILDWEMAALGDPLSDLGYLTATYATADSAPTPMELTPVTRESGYLTREEIVQRYQEQSDLKVDALGWYQTLALWKAAIFCEAIYTRWLKGERPEDTSFGPSLEEGVPELLRSAAKFADVRLAQKSR